jgi:hypothetical protein
MRPIAAASRPTVLKEDDRTTLVQFGPVRIAFPPGWQVSPAAIGSEARGPRNLETNIMVLEQSGGVSASLPEPVTAISAALEHFCPSQAQIQVELLEHESDRLSYLGSCVAAGQSEGSPYVLFFEVRSGSRIVQIISSGTTGFSVAREELALVASSVAFE